MFRVVRPYSAVFGVPEYRAPLRSEIAPTAGWRAFAGRRRGAWRAEEVSARGLPRRIAQEPPWHAQGVLTAFGAAALTFMMVMYALERRGQRYLAAFAAGCALSSAYGFLAGTWPFGVIEAIWSAIALRRWAVGTRAI